MDLLGSEKYTFGKVFSVQMFLCLGKNNCLFSLCLLSLLIFLKVDKHREKGHEGRRGMTERREMT